jgi:hypothetical protein
MSPRGAPGSGARAALVFSAAMLHRARAVIARLAGRPRTDELDERLYQLTRDVTFIRSAAMAPLVARLAPDLSQRDLLRMHELRIYSQNGEDGLLSYLFARLGTASRRVVEIGIQDGTECNARNLIDTFGWWGLLVEGDQRSAAGARALYAGRAQVREAFITRENANQVLADAAGEIDLLSIDIDGVDYWVWDAITAVRPRVVIIEYNAYLPPQEFRVVEYQPGFRRYELHPSGYYFGASLEAYRSLGESKGYVLVACESAGANAIFVQRDEAARAGLHALTAGEAYYPLTSGSKRRPAPADAYAQIAGMPFVTAGASRPVATAATGRDR